MQRSTFITIALILSLLDIGAGIAFDRLWLVLIGLVLAVTTFALAGNDFELPSVGETHQATFAVAGLLTLLTIAIKYVNVHNPLIPYLWVASMVAFVSAVWQTEVSQSFRTVVTQSTKSPFKRIMVMTPIIWIGWAMRLVQLETLPTFHGDEGEMGTFALGVMANNAPPMTGVGWLHHPALFHYLQAPFISVFDRTAFALRYPSVLVSILCIPLIFIISRRLFGPVASWSAAWLMAVSHLIVHWSRIGLNNIYSVFAIILCVYCLVHAKKDRNLAYALTGIVIGVAQYLYFGSRMIPILFGVLLLILLVRKTTSWRQVMMLTIGVLISMAPILTFYALEPVTMSSRSNSVFVLSEENTRHTLGDSSAELPKDLLRLAQVQFQRNIGYFVNHGDRSTFYGHLIPGLDKITAILFWIGLGLAIARIKRFPEQMLLLWFAIGVGLGGMLTKDAPNAPRLLIVFPAAFLMIGASMQYLDSAFSRYSKTLRLACGLGVALLIGVLNMQTYFQVFPDQPLRSSWGNSIARELQTVAEGEQTYLLGAPHFYVKHGSIMYLHGDLAKDLNTPEELDIIDTDVFTALAIPQQLELLEQIEQRYPGGEITSEYDAAGNPVYWVYQTKRDE